MDVEQRLGRVVAISPHLDDAVLSAGALLALTTDPQVVTVFAGYPTPATLTEWDESCGFTDGVDVVAARRAEDHRALQQLGGTAHWLDFLDSQYSETRPSAADIAVELVTRLKALDYDTIAFPLGIAHSDHERTHEACALLLHEQTELAAHWIAWVDVPYRVRHPELVVRRLEDLRGQGYQLERLVATPDPRKAAAMGEYLTQIRGLGASVDDAQQPEEFYVVTR
jgi:LmbE family N-acetylglucosaminyl deacetylase